MELKLVSFELAKKLKEVGFITFEKQCYSLKTFINKLDIKIKEGQLVNVRYDLSKVDSMVSAPTLELAKQWFREEHNVSIEPIRINSKADKYWFDIKMVIRGVSHSFHSISLNYCDFNSYEKALETGLLEACKLIKT